MRQEEIYRSALLMLQGIKQRVGSLRASDKDAPLNQVAGYQQKLDLAYLEANEAKLIELSVEVLSFAKEVFPDSDHKSDYSEAG